MILHLTAKPNAQSNQLVIDKDENIKVKIKAPPINGKANQELLNFLSEIFGISKSKIELLSGENNPHKKIQISGEENSIKKILEKFKNKEQE